MSHFSPKMYPEIITKLKALFFMHGKVDHSIPTVFLYVVRAVAVVYERHVRIIEAVNALIFTVMTLNEGLCTQ